MLEGFKGGGGTAIDLLALVYDTAGPASIANKSQTCFARSDTAAEKFCQIARDLDRLHPQTFRDGHRDPTTACQIRLHNRGAAPWRHRRLCGAILCWRTGICSTAVAAVPLSIGGCRTDTFAVGVQLVSKCLGCVGEAFLLGAECLTIRDGQEQVFTVCFSPISGRVFIRFPGGAGMVALGLPDFIAGADATEVASLGMEGIEAFMFVSTSGSIFFGRRRTAGSDRGNVEWCGELPPEFFPRLSLKNYASLTFQVDKLLETAQISITWVGQLLPASAALPTSRDRFDSIWLSYEW